MAIQLGAVVLNDHMLWVEKYGSEESVAQTFKRTLGGTPVLVNKQLSGTQLITLQATEKQGWLTQEQVSLIDALAKQAGLVLPLIIGAQTYPNVVFRHHEPPAFVADQLDQVGAQAPAGYYTATIKLMTI